MRWKIVAAASAGAMLFSSGSAFAADPPPGSRACTNVPGVLNFLYELNGRNRTPECERLAGFFDGLGLQPKLDFIHLSETTTMFHLIMQSSGLDDLDDTGRDDVFDSSMQTFNFSPLTRFWDFMVAITQMESGGFPDPDRVMVVFDDNPLHVRGPHRRIGNYDCTSNPLERMEWNVGAGVKQPIPDQDERFSEVQSQTKQVEHEVFDMQQVCPERGGGVDVHFDDGHGTLSAVFRGPRPSQANQIVNYTLDLTWIHSGGDTVTPEPATMLLLGTGLAGLGAAYRRRRKLDDD